MSCNYCRFLPPWRLESKRFRLIPNDFGYLQYCTITYHEVSITALCSFAAVDRFVIRLTEFDREYRAAPGELRNTP